MSQDLLSSFSLTGRRAVVTGAASGIGRETACVLAQAGAKLVLADLNEAGLVETARMIEEQQTGTALVRPTDMANRDDVEALATQAVAAHGGIDIWVNAAGIHFISTLLEAKQAQTEKLLSINMLGSYWACAAAGRVMQTQGRGSIINFSSTGADMPIPGISAYAMSKAAVNMLTQTAAAEFGPLGIRVNAVAPGFVETGMTAFRYRDETGAFNAAQRDEVRHRMAQGSPIRELGTPRDIALAVLYLASDASRHVTGQVLRVNGGVTMG